MDDSMDIDIDLGDGMNYGQEADQVVATTTTATIEPPREPDNNVIPDAYRDDFDADLPAREKVHIKGLDGVAQPLIVELIEEHAPEQKFRRIEWIDDSSANIIFYQAADASEALRRLSLSQDTASAQLELRPAKTLTTRPDLHFQVRLARVSDKKKPGAKDRSAFYLFNPEWDPENRKRDQRPNRRGRGGRQVGREDARGKRPAEKTFTEDMYDDAPITEDMDLARRMSSASFSSGEYNRRRQSYEGLELLPNRRPRNPGRDDGRLRDRTRSPEKSHDGDGRYGFDEQPTRKRARRRSWTPPNKRERLAPRAPNGGKELFAGRVGLPLETPLSNSNRGLELFPNHSAKRSRELFPHKTPLSNHRRSDALDKDESVEILTPKRSLADRITGGPTNGVSTGERAKNELDRGFTFKGASEDQSSGFSFRGASKELNPKVKELFPNKTASLGANAGKELFPASRGKAGMRRRAEDLFD